MIEFELMASQAFPVCYLAKGCLSDYYKLSSRPSRDNSTKGTNLNILSRLYSYCYGNSGFYRVIHGRPGMA